MLSYTLGVRSLDGAGPQTRGVQLSGPKSDSLKPGATTTTTFLLKNTGKTTTDGAAYTDADIYRLSVSVDGDGWSAALPNALAGVKVGASQPVQVFIKRDATSAKTATVKLTATSESDATKTMTVVYQLK